MPRDNVLFWSVKEALEREEISERTKAEVLGSLHTLYKTNQDLLERLEWLESQIDESDLEELYVKYQKKFQIDHWSGEPS
mgnify:CR=1 FL=1